jgi:hypothetical protein
MKAMEKLLDRIRFQNYVIRKDKQIENQPFFLLFNAAPSLAHGFFA